MFAQQNGQKLESLPRQSSEQGAAGRGEAFRSPRATARISSRSSVSDLRAIVVLLCLKFDLISLELKRNILLLAGLLDGGEEVADQFIGAPEFVCDDVLSAPEAVPVIVGLRTRYAIDPLTPRGTGFSIRPRIDHFDSAVLEVLGVSRRETCASRAGHRGDHGVQLADGPSCLPPSGCDVGEVIGRLVIEAQNLSRKVVIEDRLGGFPQSPLSLPVREQPDPVENLSSCHGRGEERRTRLAGEPFQHPPLRGGL